MDYIHLTATAKKGKNPGTKAKEAVGAYLRRSPEAMRGAQFLLLPFSDLSAFWKNPGRICLPREIGVETYGKRREREKKETLTQSKVVSNGAVRWRLLSDSSLLDLSSLEWAIHRWLHSADVMSGGENQRQPVGKAWK